MREEISAGGIVVHRNGSGDFRFLVIRDSYGNWGFPKGHVEAGESLDAAALREVGEETGLVHVRVRAPLAPVDWQFTFNGERIHKTCHFFLMETARDATTPQADEGISACEWREFAAAERMVTYENARLALRAAQAVVTGWAEPK
jgi:8-oxo-dGTP pyrophosphatase MutT (NUDIX family)